MSIGFNRRNSTLVLKSGSLGVVKKSTKLPKLFLNAKLLEQKVHNEYIFGKNWQHAKVL